MQGVSDLIQNNRTIDRRRHLVIPTTGDLPHDAAQDLTRAGFRQSLDHMHRLEGGDRAAA